MWVSARLLTYMGQHVARGACPVQLCSLTSPRCMAPQCAAHDCTCCSTAQRMTPCLPRLRSPYSPCLCDAAAQCQRLRMLQQRLAHGASGGFAALLTPCLGYAAAHCQRLRMLHQRLAHGARGCSAALLLQCLGYTAAH